MRRPDNRSAFILLLIFLLTACGESAPVSLEAETTTSINRWYTEAQVRQGSVVFANHCAACHGANAEGLADDWRSRSVDGSFPPPPLNGTAHAWHHPLSVLLQTIDQGGQALGGKMPPFEAILNDAEKRATIAWFQQFWTDEIYQSWLAMGGVN